MRNGIVVNSADILAGYSQWYGWAIGSVWQESAKAVALTEYNVVARWNAREAIFGQLIVCGAGARHSTPTGLR